MGFSEAIVWIRRALSAEGNFESDTEFCIS